jgi:hypothetical protein
MDMSSPQPTPKRLRTMPSPPYRKNIILDKIHPREFNSLNIIYCCEQCSYFCQENKTCAMGFKVEKHMRAFQIEEYNRSGRMAICRSQEID